MILAAALGCTWSGAWAQANAQEAGQGLGLRLGTVGIAVDYVRELRPWLDLRVGYAFGRVSGSTEEDGIDYDAEIEFGSAFALLEYRPWRGGFRIGAGVHGAAPDIGLVTRADNTQYQIGNSTYTATGRLDGDIDLGRVAPYVGLGWGGTSAGKGLGLSFDVGVMFADRPQVRLAAQGRACDSTILPCNPAGPSGFDVNDPDDARAQTFRTELERERQNVENEIKDLRYWPVVNLGVHYRF
ncbi:hypothetical protein SAMN04488120_10169 [Fontimonas thermophila]|uniref:Outer membrane protein beta-barrel domain-containing protein n=2 Tax=Fontimonas thermophila TaxID=1076937 RepID=A0A1I2H1N2_9GAMM|nr:hypothetical protein SAMN04488120_10169 [Fontimonas thermophila]